MESYPTPSDKLRWRPLRLRLRHHQAPGRLIAVEGIDGSGKSTLCDTIAGHVQASGRRCIRVMSPSAAVRAHPAWESWHQRPPTRPTIDEFGLSVMSMGDRLVQQSQNILPALEAGHVVLADRYLLSTLVYWSTAVHAVVLKRLIAPDLGIWLDAAPDTAAQRIRTSRNEPEELRDPRRLARHRHRYRRLVDHYGYVTISTDGGPAAVWTQTLRRLTPELHAAPSAQGGGSDG